MLCAENEIFHTTRKALLGCGFSHDIAEDVGWGVVSAGYISSETIPELVNCLSVFNAHHSQNPVSMNRAKFSQDGDVLTLELTPAETLVYGSLICDWLISHPFSQAVQFKLAHFPPFFAGQLLWAEYQYIGHCQISVDNGTPFRPVHLLHKTALSGSFHLEFLPQTEKQPLPAKASRIEVQDRSWQELLGFAQGSYVPETEESRLFGAGAGLQDND